MKEPRETMPALKAWAVRLRQSAVIWSFLSTALKTGVSFGVTLLLWRKLSREEIGLWGVFATVAGFTTLFDFGFQGVLSRLVAFAWAGATRLSAFGLGEEGDAPPKEGTGGPNYPLLLRLIATFKSYYLHLSLLLIILLLLVGTPYIWPKTAQFPHPGSLRLAWAVYAVASCLIFYFHRWNALLMGVGAVKEAQQFAIVCQLVSQGVLLAGICGGLGFWALALGVAVNALAMYPAGKGFFLRAARLPGGLPAARFHRDLFAITWPLSWREGLTGLGYFLISQTNALVCAQYLGLRTMGAYAITMQLVAAMTTASAVWIGVKLPLFNHWRAQRRTGEIARVFVTRLRWTLLSYLAGAAVMLWLAPPLLAWWGHKELLPLPQLAFLLGLQLLELHNSLHVAMTLTEHQNPFLKPILLSGAAISALSLLLTPRFGVWGMLVPIAVVQLAYNYWWTPLRALRGLGVRPRDYLLALFGLKQL